MAHPKRKTSTTRRDKRRTHYKSGSTSIMKCPQCGETKMTHRACANCGYYRGRPIISVS